MQDFEGPLAIVPSWRHSEDTHGGGGGMAADTLASSWMQDAWLWMSHQWEGSAADLFRSGYTAGAGVKGPRKGADVLRHPQVPLKLPISQTGILDLIVSDLKPNRS